MTQKRHRQFRVQLNNNESLRVDQFIASTGLFSRSQVQVNSIEVLDQKKQRLKYSKRLKNGDLIFIQWEPQPAESFSPEPVPINIIYENENAVIINKKQGMVVHPAAGHSHGTLAQGLMHRYTLNEKNFEPHRAGIVHRLDKDTSGVMIAAKNVKAHEFLSAQFEKRHVQKTYIALVKGTLPLKKNDITLPIGRDPSNRKRFTVNARNAREAITRYVVLEQTENYSLVALYPRTGRTHQIRVHMKSLGCPIIGDPIYSRRDARLAQATLMLHSLELRIKLPDLGPMSFVAQVPDHIIEILEQVKMGNISYYLKTHRSGFKKEHRDSI